jgi:hypothetical protein
MNAWIYLHLLKDFDDWKNYDPPIDGNLPPNLDSHWKEPELSDANRTTLYTWLELHLRWYANTCWEIIHTTEGIGVEAVVIRDAFYHYCMDMCIDVLWRPGFLRATLENPMHMSLLWDLDHFDQGFEDMIFGVDLHAQDKPSERRNWMATLW